MHIIRDGGKIIITLGTSSFIRWNSFQTTGERTCWTSPARESPQAKQNTYALLNFISLNSFLERKEANSCSYLALVQKEKKKIGRRKRTITNGAQQTKKLRRKRKDRRILSVGTSRYPTAAQHNGGYDMLRPYGRSIWPQVNVDFECFLRNSRMMTTHPLRHLTRFSSSFNNQCGVKERNIWIKDAWPNMVTTSNKEGGRAGKNSWTLNVEKKISVSFVAGGKPWISNDVWDLVFRERCALNFAYTHWWRVQTITQRATNEHKAKEEAKKKQLANDGRRDVHSPKKEKLVVDELLVKRFYNWGQTNMEVKAKIKHRKIQTYMLTHTQRGMNVGKCLKFVLFLFQRCA